MVPGIHLNSLVAQRPIEQRGLDQQPNHIEQRGPAEVPREMAADAQNALLAVNRHHAEGGDGVGANQGHAAPEGTHAHEGGIGEKIGKAITHAGTLSKLASNITGNVSHLVVNEVVSENLKHFSEASGKAAGALAVVTAPLAAYEGIKAQGEINRGNAAQKELAETLITSMNSGIEADPARTAQLQETIAKGVEAKETRTAAALEFFKSSAEVVATGLEIAHKPIGALVGGVATGVVMTTQGALDLSKASSRKDVMNQKMGALDRLASSSKTENTGKALRAAAEDIKASREKHIGNLKTSGAAKLSVGLAALGMIAVGLLAGAALAVSAPALLPALGICLAVAGVGAAVYGVVRNTESKRSEKKINEAINTSVQNQGQMSHDQITEHLTAINSKNVTRDTQRMVKINKATFAVNQTLDKLANLPQGLNSLKTRHEMISRLVDNAFSSGTGKSADLTNVERTKLRRDLENIRLENVDAMRGALLSRLVPSMLGSGRPS